MSISPKKSLAFKLLSVSAVAITLLLIATFSFVILQARDRTVATVLEQAQAEARAMGAAVDSAVNNLAGATASMAGAIENGMTTNALDRSTISQMLKAAVENFDLVFGSWVVQAPGSFDGVEYPRVENMDAATNANGFFSPYWTRGENGLDLVIGDGTEHDAEYYRLSATSLSGAATEPYVEPSANDMLMMSVTQPIVVKGELRGVLGVDVGLGTLAAALADARPFGTGRVYLLSGAGKWLTAPNPDTVMQEYAADSASDVLNAIAAAEPIVVDNVVGQDGGEVYRIVHTFPLQGLDANWAVAVDVPESVVANAVNQQTLILAAGGLIMLLAVMGALFAAIRVFVQKPLGSLLGEVGRLSEGQLEDEVSGQKRKDEIGQVAAALEIFRHKLSHGKVLERTTAQQREDADRERSRTDKERAEAEADRARAAQDQQQVVEELAKGLSRLADGNLAYRINGPFPPAYEDLRIAYNTSLERFAEVINQLRSSSKAMKLATGEILSGANDLAERTTRQAAAIEETSAAIDGLSTTVSENADRCQTARGKAEVVANSAELGGKVMQEAREAMERIKTSSDKISDIIGMIDDIAFQTNLLALNASVEAARAGDAGKGFAVVAVEVRRLAQSAASASSDVKALIEQSSNEVKEGSRLVTDVAGTLTAMLGDVRENRTIVTEIAEASKSQSSSIREISGSIRQMDEMTQHNAALVEETNAAIEQTESQANELEGVVARFIVSGSATPAVEDVAKPRATAAARYLPTSGANALKDDWDEF
ncbi:methyl-accepting chemotaxis protein [Pelagibacterium sp.]|uniref:methyl-accepting chemotaxis protein n=1 Tax=Pelagibacterium sp. TaxID=1967288 RepID=UPI003A921FA5